MAKDEKRQQLVVGVDFGTTYTGLAFAYTGTTDLSKIELIQTWPGKSGGLDNKKYDKVPTEISFENNKVTWGYQLAPGANRLGCFKLLLDGRTKATSFDDTNLNLEVDPGNLNATFTLPPGMSAHSVSEEYFRQLYRHVMERLERRMLETLDLTPIHFVITTPAVWSHAAQTATKDASHKAGFGSRPGDTISMISEPEAAANYCLREIDASEGTSFNSVFKVGDEFVICDAGGGTVDLITYAIVETSPVLKIKESVVGSGGKCGSTTVDRAFLRLLRKKLGPAFEKWPAKRTGRGSSLMSKFEEAKRDFGGHDEDQIWRIPLGNVPDDEANGIENGELLLTPDDMENLFKEAIVKIVELVDDQVAKSEARSHKKIRSILLVGGFGQSEYLFDTLFERYSAKSIRIVQSASAWSAVVKGAVVSGHQTLITARRLKYHYGVALGKPFRYGIDKEADAFNCPFTGMRFARGYISWFAAKGDEVDQGKKIEIPCSNSLYGAPEEADSGWIRLYGSASDIAPLRKDSHDVFPIGSFPVEYSLIPRSQFQIKVHMGRIISYVQCNIGMEVGSAELTFRLTVDGQEYGSTTLDMESRSLLMATKGLTLGDD